MRQTGVLAAAGLVAIDEVLPNLATDHANTARLAEGLGALGFEVDATARTLPAPLLASMCSSHGRVCSNLLAAAVSVHPVA